MGDTEFFLLAIGKSAGVTLTPIADEYDENLHRLRQATIPIPSRPLCAAEDRETPRVRAMIQPPPTG